MITMRQARRTCPGSDTVRRPALGKAAKRKRARREAMDALDEEEGT